MIDPFTTTFLVIGGLSVLLLLISVVIGDLGHLAADADGPFSLPAIAAFLGGVGFGGAVAASLLDGLPTAPRLLASLAAGAVVALPLAYGALRLTSGLMRMRTDETLTAHSVLGSQGVIVTAVTGPASFGEVRLTIGGHTLKYNARSQHPLAVGTPVYVIDIPSETSVEVVSTAADAPEPVDNAADGKTSENPDH